MAGEVRKGVLSALRKPKIAGPILRTGVTRGGRVGVEIEHQGVKGWGMNESAAHAAWQLNRSAMAKRDAWEVPGDHFEPATPRRRPNYRDGSGNVVGKRMTGAVTGVAKPKKVQPTRLAPRKAAGQLPIGVPPIPPSQVGKRKSKHPKAEAGAGLAMYGLAAHDLATGAGATMIRGLRPRGGARIARGVLEAAGADSLSRHSVGKALNEAQQRRLFQVGARMNRGKDDQRAELAANSRRHLSRQAGDRWERGAKHPTRAARRRGFTINDFEREINARNVASRSTATDRSRTDVFKRDRKYNPEHGRQRRLGVATAATGIGGAAAIHSGVRDVAATRGHLRGIDPSVIRVPKEPTRPRHQVRDGGKFRSPTDEERASAHAEYDAKVGRRAQLLNTHTALTRAREAGEHGAVVTRRSGGKLAVGAGLLASAAGISRYSRGRSNREWR